MMNPNHVAPGLRDFLHLPPATGSALSCDLVLCNVMIQDPTGMELFERVLKQKHALSKRFAFATGGVLTPQATAFPGPVTDPVLSEPLERGRALHGAEVAAATRPETPRRFHALDVDADPSGPRASDRRSPRRVRYRPGAAVVCAHASDGLKVVFARPVVRSGMPAVHSLSDRSCRPRFRRPPEYRPQAGSRSTQWPIPRNDVPARRRRTGFPTDRDPRGSLHRCGTEENNFRRTDAAIHRSG